MTAPVRIAHSVGPETSLCEGIVEAIATAEVCDPLELTTPLYEHVDPEALEQLVGTVAHRDPSSTWRITFEYEGYEVEVKAATRVIVSVRKEGRTFD